MKLSVILLTANPTEKQYAWKEAFASYCALADEVIVVNGGKEPIVFPDTKLRTIIKPDPEVWTWSEHAKNLNLGLDEATGDWIIKVDIDWIFHERNLHKIRQKLNSSEAQKFPVATMQKYTFYPFRRYIQKGQIPMIINAKFKDKIRFGKDLTEYTDLTYPIYWGGNYDESGVPTGKLVKEKDWGKTGELFWNFDYTFATLEMMKKKWVRMSKSHKEYFGTTDWGETEEEALKQFITKQQAKHGQSLDIMDSAELPKYIRQRISDLKPEEFGHSAWGLYK